MSAEAFIKSFLGSDELYDTFSRDQVVQMVSQALQESADMRSDFDERRIQGLLKTLKQIEDTTSDVVAGAVARRSRVNEEDE